jgi:hypothetical protein
MFEPRTVAAHGQAEGLVEARGLARSGTLNPKRSSN